MLGVPYIRKVCFGDSTLFWGIKGVPLSWEIPISAHGLTGFKRFVGLEGFTRFIGLIGFVWLLGFLRFVGFGGITGFKVYRAGFVGLNRSIEFLGFWAL